MKQPSRIVEVAASERASWGRWEGRRRQERDRGIPAPLLTISRVESHVASHAHAPSAVVLRTGLTLGQTESTR